MEIICPTCKGRGSVRNPDVSLDQAVTCPTCKGKHWVKSSTFPQGYKEVVEAYELRPTIVNESMITTT